MKYILYLVIIGSGFLFSTCCGSFMEVEEFCQDQIFLESKTVPIEFTYTVNKVGKILEAHKLTGPDIQKALKVEGSNFNIKRIELTSASIAYLREADNVSPAMFASFAVVDNSAQLVALTKKDLFLPLVDIPVTVFSPEININKELNEKGVAELKKVLRTYFDLLNNDGISFILLAEGSPQGTLAHFQLKVKMWVSLTYEICRYAPLGVGQRVCE